MSAVVLEESDGGYRLGGRVPTYYLKQVALAAACEVAGHRPIFNEIEVITPNPRPGRGTWGTSAPTAPPRELEGRLVP